MEILRMCKPVYRAGFLSGAVRSGLLASLRDGPLPLEQIAVRLRVPMAQRDALGAWLDMGVRVGALRRRDGGYGLGDALSRRLARKESDAAGALLEELTRLHAKMLDAIPGVLAEGRRLTLSDQEGPLVARSSRTLEPIVCEAVDDFVPAEGAPRLLEIGAGSGVYVRRAAERNAKLTAFALELQPDVAELARRNLEGWGLGDRVKVEAGDVRGRTPSPEFDLATLHNNIYYFAVADRPALLRHVAGFLRPGGRLLLTTACRGGSLLTEMLSLWGAATEGCGPLPTPDEMVAHIKDAGFNGARAKKLFVGDQYYAFVGQR